MRVKKNDSGFTMIELTIVLPMMVLSFTVILLLLGAATKTASTATKRFVGVSAQLADVNAAIADLQGARSPLACDNNLDSIPDRTPAGIGTLNIVSTVPATCARIISASMNAFEIQFTQLGPGTCFYTAKYGPYAIECFEPGYRTIYQASTTDINAKTGLPFSSVKRKTGVTVQMSVDTSTVPFTAVGTVVYGVGTPYYSSTTVRI
jgi:type II secretory pathway pseudopilin PulG